MTYRIFLHGLDSSSQGTKGRYFKEMFPGMIVPDFSGSLSERMEKLNDILSGESEITIVGSSYGGLMATIFAMENESRMDRLFLLAPAINYLRLTPYQIRKIDIPVQIYHGTKDDVIPLNDVEEITPECFSNLVFHKVEDDHMLHDTFGKIDWEKLLI